MGLKSGPQKTATPPGTGGCGIGCSPRAGRARAMTIRIAVSVLAILAVSSARRRCVGQLTVRSPRFGEHPAPGRARAIDTEVNTSEAEPNR